MEQSGEKEGVGKATTFSGVSSHLFKLNLQVNGLK